MIPDNPACEIFTVLASRPSEDISRCDVCDYGEDAHAKSGRRLLTGGEIEALRRQMLIAIHEKREAENPSQFSGNGSSHAGNINMPRPDSGE